MRRAAKILRGAAEAKPKSTQSQSKRESRRHQARSAKGIQSDQPSNQKKHVHCLTVQKAAEDN
jgi:hypothetical protein